MSSPKKPLWTCPRCGHRFVTKNLWHSCSRHTIAEHFAGKPPILRRTFSRFAAVARECGPVTVYAQKTRIVIQARVRFAGAVVRKGWLDAGVWLKRRARHLRLVRTESFGAAGFGLHFRLEKPEDVDEALTRLVREAYRIARARGGEELAWAQRRAQCKGPFTGPVHGKAPVHEESSVHRRTTSPVPAARHRRHGARLEDVWG